MFVCLNRSNFSFRSAYSPVNGMKPDIPGHRARSSPYASLQPTVELCGRPAQLAPKLPRVLPMRLKQAGGDHRFALAHYFAVQFERLFLAAFRNREADHRVAVLKTQRGEDSGGLRVQFHGVGTADRLVGRRQQLACFVVSPNLNVNIGRE